MKTLVPFVQKWDDSILPALSFESLQGLVLSRGASAPELDGVPFLVWAKAGLFFHDLLYEVYEAILIGTPMLASLRGSNTVLMPNGSRDADCEDRIRYCSETRPISMTNTIDKIMTVAVAQPLHHLGTRRGAPLAARLHQRSKHSVCNFCAGRSLSAV